MLGYGTHVCMYHLKYLFKIVLYVRTLFAYFKWTIAINILSHKRCVSSHSVKYGQREDRVWGIVLRAFKVKFNSWRGFRNSRNPAWNRPAGPCGSLNFAHFCARDLCGFYLAPLRWKLRSRPDLFPNLDIRHCYLASTFIACSLSVSPEFVACEFSSDTWRAGKFCTVCTRMWMGMCSDGTPCLSCYT